MKRLNFLFLGVMASFAAIQAQTETILSTFEDDEFVEDQHFMNETVDYYPSSWVGESMLYNCQDENPDKTGINRSDKVFSIKSKVDIQSGWWTNTMLVRFEGNAPIDDSNRFLHMMHFRTGKLAGWRLDIKFDTGDFVDGIGSGDGQNAENKWADLVFDLNSHRGKIVTEIKLHVNTNWAEIVLPQTDFYIDNVVQSSSSSPRGIYDNLIQGNSILDFEDETQTNAVASIWAPDYAIPSVFFDNPTTDGINPSSKCAYFGGGNQVDGVNWWHGFEIQFNQYIKVTEENRYLHMMLKREDYDGQPSAPECGSGPRAVDITYLRPGENKQIALYEGDPHDGNGSGTALHLTGEWVDYVKELPVGEIISRMEIKMNHSIGYLDNLWIDNDPKPRVLTVNSQNEIDNAGVYTLFARDKGIEVGSISGKALNVRVYDISGLLCAEATVTGEYTFNVPGGIYIVKINDNAEKVIVR